MTFLAISVLFGIIICSPGQSNYGRIIFWIALAAIALSEQILAPNIHKKYHHKKSSTAYKI